MRMKLQIDHVNSRHVHLSVFSDPSVTNNRTFAHLGRLIMGIGEYQTFGAALLLGAKQMRGHLIIIHDDQKFKEWADKEEARFSARLENEKKEV